MSKNISPIITLLTVIVISIVVIIFPLGYFFVSYQNITGNLESEAEINARIITRVISSNPEMWEYEQLRFQEYLSRRPGKRSPEKRRVLNIENKLVAESSDTLEAPLIMQASNLYDSGKIVGRIEIYRSIRPIIKQTALIALFMLPVGLGVFLILWFIPIRIIYRSENTMRKSEKRYRDLSHEFQTVLDCIRDPLLQLGHDLKILWSNEGATAGFGTKTNEITGRHCYELWHGRSAPCEKCVALRSFETGVTEGTQISTAEGRLFDERAFPVKNDDDSIKSVVVMAVDITAKADIEAEMLRAGHLASLGELSAGIAHEINNPVSGVINYAQILADRAGKGSRDRDMAELIIKEAARIAEIVRGLLSFARERKDEKMPVRISDILNETLSLTMTHIRKDSIHLIIDMPEYIARVMVNPQQLQQVFLNVINNARYALNERYPGPHENKKLVVQGEEVTVADIPYVRTSFLDYGPGIPSDIMLKVINPFFTTKPAGSGTGLGLSISYGIIKDHGGKLKIESEQGKFTKVIIDLPITEDNGR